MNGHDNNMNGHYDKNKRKSKEYSYDIATKEREDRDPYKLQSKYNKYS